MAERIENVCRCCLKTGASQYIFKVNIFGQQSIIYAEMIETCSSFPVELGDNLPDHVCFSCITELELSYKFHLKCNQSYKTLKKIKELPGEVKDSKEVLRYTETKSFTSNGDNNGLLLSNPELIENKSIKIELEVDNNLLNHDSYDDFSIFGTKEEDEKYDPEPLEDMPIKIKTKIKTSKVCPLCSMEFKKKSDLKRHMKTHPDFTQEKYFCNLCEKYYKSERRHRSTHTVKDLPVECQICKKLYKKSNIDTHMQIHSQSREYVCKECGASFKQYAGLYKHKSTHRDKSLGCEFCAKKFRSKYNLTVHLRVHTQEKPYICPVCPLTFKTGNLRNVHLLTHSEDEIIYNEDIDKDILQSFLGLKESAQVRKRRTADLKCSHCDKTFQRYTFLKEHIDSHLGIKSYFCEICQDFFLSKRRHSSVHAVKKPEECDICLKTFANKQVLKEHKRIHSDERAFICHCGAAFKQQAALHKHRLLHEEKAFICHYCSKPFSTKYKLTIHLRIHTKERPYPCDLCPRKFVTGNLLKTHKLRHSDNKSISCHLCEKTFKTKNDLRQHIKVHEKKRKYPCKVCNRGFYRSDHRSRHEAMVHSLQEKSMDIDDSNL